MTDSTRRHRRLALLGEGGMAQVFLSMIEGVAGSKKFVVVKRLRPELSENGEYLRMFLDEARLSMRLGHPNIVQTYEVATDEDGEGYFITMEYLDGQSLLGLIAAGRRSGQPVPRPLLLHVVLEVLAGLSYAHDLTDFDGKPLNIVHRDISPHNVFVTYDGQVKVVDFGIAKAASSLERTQSGVFKGKATYASPEQALAMVVDQRADVFSAGVILWEILAGKRMWAGRAEAAILVDLVSGKIPALDDSVAPELAAIARKALSPDAKDRYHTAAEFRDALEGAIATLGERTTSRELSQYMNATFQDERSRIRKIVESQVRQSQDEASEGALPLIRSVPPEAAATRALGEGTPGSRARTGAKPVTHSNSEDSMTHGGIVTPTVVVRRRRLVAAAFALGAAAFALGLVAWSKSERNNAIAAEHAPSVPSVTATSTPPPSAPAGEATTVTFAVTSDPPTATALLDGTPVGSVPTFLKKDGAKHRLVVSAAGFTTREQDIALDKDVNLLISLSPQVEAPRGAKTTPPTSRPQPKRNAKIDEESPYSP